MFFVRGFKNMSRERISLKSKTDKTLFGNAWTVENPIANVIIVTGMKETSARYDDFAKFLNKNKLNVYCIDHFGQGENVIENKECLGIWPKSGFRKYVNILDELVAKLRLSCLPTYILGHSMGSFVVQDYIQRYTKHISRVVIVGSAKINGVSLAYRLARLITTKKNVDKPSKFLDKLVLGNANKRCPKPLKCEADWLSTNEANNEGYMVNPLCGGVYSHGFYREFLKGLSRLWKRRFLKKIRKDMSILIVSGAEDPIGGYSKRVMKLDKMYKKLGLNDVNTIIYPNMRHEILNEIDKEVVYNDILNFLVGDIKEDAKKVDKQDRTM